MGNLYAEYRRTALRATGSSTSGLQGMEAVGEGREEGGKNVRETEDYK